MGLIFKQELAQLIVEGKKTQTRRPVKAFEKLVIRDGLKTMLSAKGRICYQVGRDYAVMYGRGKPSAWWSPQDGILIAYNVYQSWREKYGERWESAGM